MEKLILFLGLLCAVQSFGQKSKHPVFYQMFGEKSKAGIAIQSVGDSTISILYNSATNYTTFKESEKVLPAGAVL